MLGRMQRLASWWLFPCLCLPLTAQRTLADLQQQFIGESQRLAAGEPSAEQRQQLLGKQVEELRKFLDGPAQGDDRWNGRLMLADLNLARGDRKAAIEALRGIDKGAAPALLLVTAATMAQHLALRDLREQWIAAALAKEAPLADRLAMARMLMTVLLEVDKGESLFAAALTAAGDDEQRAFVRWHRADALRDREDLPENAGFDELDRLAKDLPNTYWGSVAKDRLRATQLRVGDDAIGFTTKTNDGASFRLADQAGKVVVLAFWSLADQDTPGLVATLQQLRKVHGDRVRVLGISIDRDPAAIAKAIVDLGIDFPVVGDGLGVMTDVALRWFVEGPSVHVLDSKGKVAALGLHTGTADGRTELLDVVTNGVKP